MDEISKPGSSIDSTDHQLCANMADSSTTIRVDEECHNEYYRAMRSGNIELLETLTSKHSGSKELENLLAEAYEELKLKNVALTDEMELCVGGKLLDLRFFETTFNETESNTTIDHIMERIAIVIESINSLVKQYSGEEEVDERFIVMGKFIIQNIHILKHQLKCTYDRLPWEEIEFCLIAYVSTNMYNNEMYWGFISTKGKMLKYLENFSGILNSELRDIKRLNPDVYLGSSTNIPKRGRDSVVKTIIEKNPAFGVLYNDYKLLRDIYSLETMKRYLDVALSTNCKDKDGQLVIIRALQVIGENLKNTLASPKLSSSTAELLLMSLPRNINDILTELRDSLSHDDSLSIRSEIEKNPDVSFFSNIQNDIETINETIIEILLKSKIEIIIANLQLIARCEKTYEIKELVKLFRVCKIKEIISENFIEASSEKLKKLIEKLHKFVKCKTPYEETLFTKMHDVIKDKKSELSNMQLNYVMGIGSFSGFYETINNTIDVSRNQIVGIKYSASKVLENLNSMMEPGNYQRISILLWVLVNSVRSRMNEDSIFELVRLVYNVYHLINYGMRNVTGIEEFKDILDEGQLSQNNTFHLDDELSFLKCFLTRSGLSEQCSKIFSDFKNNKKLQAVVEMLLLDIMSILNSSQKKLHNHVQLFDASSPLLVGRQLRNHLDHGNAINDILPFQQSGVLLLNARKIVTENVSHVNRKICKLTPTNFLSLKDKNKHNLITLSNQREFFVSIAEGNIEQFNILASKGADILSRSNNLWTALHYAAKGSNVEFVKFLLDQKIPIDAKDVFGRTPLHIAAMHDRHTIIMYFLEEPYVSVNDIDNSGKTALHLAALNGHIETVKILLKLKANTSAEDSSGSTPLHCAEINNFKEVAETLSEMESTADSNKMSGVTSLHIGAECGHLQLLSSLLDRNANVKARSDRGAVPSVLQDQISTPGASIDSTDHQLNMADSSTTIRVDEECHNEYYRAMRSGNIKLLKTLTSKHPGSKELEDLLAEAYEELKLKNVALTDKMELFVGSKLLDLRFFETGFNETESDTNIDRIMERIVIVIESIKCLVKQYSGEEEVDERFIVMGKFIIQNIHILKHQLKCTYDRLPWEEIEFCLIAYVSTNMYNNEMYWGFISTKGRILKYLKKFSDILNSELRNIKRLNPSKLTKIPKDCRDSVVETIIKKNPAFRVLYDDYKLLRDIYSLETMRRYLDVALSTNCKDKDGQLVIIRALQVIGENLKNTLESPRLSSSTAELLLMSLPRNIKEILTKLQDSLSHDDSLSIRSEIEKNPYVSFFSNIQNEIQIINETIIEILLKSKIEIIVANLQLMARCEKTYEIKELVKLFRVCKIKEIISENFIEASSEKLKKLIEKLHKFVKCKTPYAGSLFSKMHDVINEKKIELSNMQSDYIMEFRSFSRFYESLNNTIDISKNKILAIKYSASKVLEHLNSMMEPGHYQQISILLRVLVKSVRSRMNEDSLFELVRLVYNVNHLIHYGMRKVTGIEEFKDILDVGKHSQNNRFHLDEKLSFLKCFLTISGLIEQSSKTFSDFKNNKKLQAVVEMLLLDIMSILNSSQETLHGHVQLFDASSPLLVGKQLRNHMAHGNAINDVLTFQQSGVILLNARKLVTENVSALNRKICKLKPTNFLSLKRKIKHNLITLTNQRELFVSIAEGNIEQFNSLASRGADILSRSNNLWTALHYAAKGSNVEFIKFLIDQNIPIDAKDIFGRTPLHIAAMHGRHTIIKYFLEEILVSVNDIDNSGKTALHLAAQNGHIKTVKILLKLNANTSAEDISGSAPLHCAVRNNFKEVAETLLEMEPTADSNKMSGGFTSLHIGAEYGHVQLVSFLLDRNANVNARTDLGAVPLHLAAINSHVEVVAKLLNNKNKANVDAKTLLGLTPLYNAVETGNEEVVKVLLHHNADVNVVADTHKCSPLNYAAREGYENIVELLLNKQAHVNNATNLGLTPLHDAAANGHANVVRILVKNGASVAARSKIGSTALHACAQGGHSEIVKILISKEFGVDVLDINNNTPLHLAAGFGTTQVLETLIMEGANIHATNINDMSVLHCASATGRKNNVELLLAKGAKDSIRTRNIQTPLHVAVQETVEHEVVEVLIKGGIDIDAEDIDGSTALHIAALHGKKKIVETLMHNKANIDAECKRGFTPMHLAVIHGHVEVLKYLIEKGANVDISDRDGLTPLCHSIIQNQKKMANILIRKVANLNVVNSRPLSLAVHAGSKDIVTDLLEDKNVSIDSAKYLSLLHIAALQGRSSGTDFLEATTKKLGANHHIVQNIISKIGMITKVINYRCEDPSNFLRYRETDLHKAANNGNEVLVRRLIDYGFDINTQDSDGTTPLLFAVNSGHKSIVEILLNSGAKLSLVTKHDNNTPLHIATLKGYKEVVDVILNHSKRTFIGNQFNDFLNAKATIGGFTPLHVAAKNGLVEIVKSLLVYGAIYNSVDFYNRTPLDVATDENVIASLKLIDELFKYTENGNLHLIDRIHSLKCDEYFVIANAKNIQCETLVEAAFNNGYEIFSLMIEDNLQLISDRSSQ